MADKKNSAARIAANNRYGAKAYDRLSIAVPKGKKEAIKGHATTRGETLNAFINRAIDETVDRDGSLSEAAGGCTQTYKAESSILTPETLQTAQEAAQAAKEDVPAFLSRAVKTQAERDKVAQEAGR